MSKEEAIALARQEYANDPEYWHKLRPRPNRTTGTWVVECWVTPIWGYLRDSLVEAPSNASQ